jgi:hypothetical protein
MAIMLKKKVFHHGATSCIGLPQSWLRFYGNRASEITLMGGSILLIVPGGLEPQAEALVKQMENMPGLLQGGLEAPDLKTIKEVTEHDC